MSSVSGYHFSHSSRANAYKQLIWFVVLFFKILFIYLFLGCDGASSLIRLSLVSAGVRATLSLWCVGFSLEWLLLLWSVGCRAHPASAVAALGSEGPGSVVAAHGLKLAPYAGSSQIRDRTCASFIGTWILYYWATRKAPNNWFWART